VPFWPPVAGLQRAPHVVVACRLPRDTPPPTAKPYTEQHSYSTVPPPSPASVRRQQQLQHLRAAREQHNLEREERCLADGGAAAAGGARPRAPKALNAAQQARVKHNQGVKASSNVSVGAAGAHLQPLPRGVLPLPWLRAARRRACGSFQLRLSNTTLHNTPLRRPLRACAPCTSPRTWSSCGPSSHPGVLR
jgi:hypothetical protein